MNSEAGFIYVCCSCGLKVHGKHMAAHSKECASPAWMGRFRLHGPAKPKESSNGK